MRELKVTISLDAAATDQIRLCLDMHAAELQIMRYKEELIKARAERDAAHLQIENQSIEAKQASDKRKILVDALEEERNIRRSARAEAQKVRDDFAKTLDLINGEINGYKAKLKEQADAITFIDQCRAQYLNERDQARADVNHLRGEVAYWTRMHDEMTHSHA